MLQMEESCKLTCILREPRWTWAASIISMSCDVGLNMAGSWDGAIAAVV